MSLGKSNTTRRMDVSEIDFEAGVKRTNDHIISFWRVGDVFRPRLPQGSAYGIGTLCVITKITMDRIFFKRIK